MPDSTLNNSGPWPGSLIAKFGPNAFIVVRSVRQALHRDEVLAIVEPYELDDNELAIVMTSMGTAIPPAEPPVKSVSVAAQRREAKVVNITKSKFYAAAWRSGAAYRQIARLMGVSHQTVYTLASRVLGLSPERSAHPISDEQCAALLRNWQENPNREFDQLVESFQGIINNWSD